ncbi:Aquaporin-1 [Saitoella coloradoensis]
MMKFPLRRHEVNPNDPYQKSIFQWKNEFVAICGEFVGTTMFLMFAFGGCNIANLNTSSDSTSSGNSSSVNATADAGKLIYISLAFGFSLAINVWAFFRISGGLFNPAVSLALALAGAIPPVRMITLTIAQILGGIVAAAIVDAITPGGLAVTTTLVSGMSITRGLFLEMFLTAELVFVILMLAAEKNKSTFLAPIGIGLALFVAELWGVYYTGGSLNPARSFGPAVAARSFVGYHWIYWVGPFLGSLLATGFYKFVKWLDYHSAVAGQDASSEAEAEREKARHDPEAAGGAHD